ncbi:MAG: flagellar hook-length control protein FliK [Sphingomonadales bacterium]
MDLIQVAATPAKPGGPGAPPASGSGNPGFGLALGVESPGDGQPPLQLALATGTITPPADGTLLHPLTDGVILNPLTDGAVLNPLIDGTTFGTSLIAGADLNNIKPEPAAAGTASETALQLVAALIPEASSPPGITVRAEAALNAGSTIITPPGGAVFETPGPAMSGVNIPGLAVLTPGLTGQPEFAGNGDPKPAAAGPETSLNPLSHTVPGIISSGSPDQTIGIGASVSSTIKAVEPGSERGQTVVAMTPGADKKPAASTTPDPATEPGPAATVASPLEDPAPETPTSVTTGEEPPLAAGTPDLTTTPASGAEEVKIPAPPAETAEPKIISEPVPGEATEPAPEATATPAAPIAPADPEISPATAVVEPPAVVPAPAPGAETDAVKEGLPFDPQAASGQPEQRGITKAATKVAAKANPAAEAGLMRSRLGQEIFGEQLKAPSPAGGPTTETITTPLSAAARVSFLNPTAQLIAGGLSALEATVGDPPGAAAAAAARTQPFAASQAAQHLGLQISKAVAKGKTEFSIRMNPPELGRVDIKIDFSADGRVRAAVVVESRETLNLLQRDSQALHKAMADSGFDSDQGSLNFSLKQDNQEARLAFLEGLEKASAEEGVFENALPGGQDLTGDIIRLTGADRVLDIRI